MNRPGREGGPDHANRPGHEGGPDHANRGREGRGREGRENPDLERRYRRLMRVYPRSHRREYEEEMLGVLLAGAVRRDRPSPGDVADLLRGGLAVRGRVCAEAVAGPRWRDALAVAGLVAALMTAGDAVGLLALLPDVLLAEGSGALLREVIARDGLSLVWLAVVAAVVARWRHAAAVAWGTLGLTVLAGLPVTLGIPFPGGPELDPVMCLNGFAAAAALTVSGGPARAFGLLGPARFTVLCLFAAAHAFPVYGGLVLGDELAVRKEPEAAVLLGLAAAAVALAPRGLRLAVALALPAPILWTLYHVVPGYLPPTWPWPLGYAGPPPLPLAVLILFVIPPLAWALLLAAVAWLRRRTAPRAPGPDHPGPGRTPSGDVGLA
ncbi:hypothetical protein [Bailinhaonella thermotolerans]|uniref:Uncharacterized protein n=1 Tax=Bailinhaonella thermotolerans TaxID=1070861 RepID=A0A3A4BRU5_9ACTN|nr:hypothetical protein [Bailinhaonella thermotolerans]RJL34046.1 hypothetical protein D5H75_05935 [Bailinhaonella thermotolerans]